MKASVTSKVSEEACTTGVRVCCWGSDPRRVFAEIGRAVGRTELSKLYLSNKLAIPGHQPAPDPGARPERSRKFIKALLPQQMKCFTLDDEGHLVIPTEDEMSQACISLNEEHTKTLSQWRVEFPRHEAATPQPSKRPRLSTQTEANNSEGNTPEPGTQVTNTDELSENFGDEVVTEMPLLVGSDAKNLVVLALGESKAADGAQKCLRVWLHNKSTKKGTLPVSTLLGQGGRV